MPPAAATFSAAARPMPDDAPVMIDGLAVDGALEGAVLVQVGVELALVVVPELLGVVGQRRDRDVRVAQRALRVAGVEAAAERDVLDDLVRDAEVGEEVRTDLLERGQLQREAEHALGQVLRRALVDPHHGLGRVTGLGERVQDLADALALGVDDVEGGVLDLGLVGDVVDGGGDVVDRDDVRPAPLEADQREPLRQHVPDLLDDLEEVVRAVDLVHLAGAAVADDEAGAVDPDRRLDALADELLGLELRAVVRVGQLLALVEHVLGEDALVVEPGDGDRGHVMERAEVELVGQLDRVLGAADVGQRVAGLVRAHVVDRGEVEEVVDPRQRRGIDAEPVLAEVAHDRLDPVRRRPSARAARRASRASPRGRARGCRPRARAGARRGGVR